MSTEESSGDTIENSPKEESCTNKESCTINTELSDSHLETDLMLVDISPKKDGGILKGIKKAGCGTDRPLAGDQLYVHYVGTLKDGTVFDSSRDKNQEYSFTLGKAEVIIAWEFGLASMTLGEIAVFHCKSEYAYGAEGIADMIPPNTDLIFEVEMLGWHGEDISENKDGSIFRSLLVKGESYGIPNDGADCTVHIIGKYQGQIFEDRTVSFKWGEGLEVGIVDGVELALKSFSRGEKARLKIQQHLAYGNDGCPEYNIPPNADLDYEVFLEDCVRAKDFWDMSSAEKMEQAIIDKNKGTEYYKCEKLKMASKFFKKAIEYLQYEDLYEACDGATRKSVLLASQLNLAMCELKMSNPFDAEQICNKVLELDPGNEKGLFRRGTAYLTMKIFDLAVRDFKSCLEVNPENRLARQQFAIAAKNLVEVRKLEKETYYGMFDKFSKSDDNQSEDNASSFTASNSEYMNRVNEMCNEILKDVADIDINTDLAEILKPDEEDVKDGTPKDDTTTSTDGVSNKCETCEQQDT